MVFAVEKVALHLQFHFGSVLNIRSKDGKVRSRYKCKESKSDASAKK